MFPYVMSACADKSLRVMQKRGVAMANDSGDDKEELKIKGARDEFEALCIVVKQDKILFQKVMEKVKRHRELSSKSTLDLFKQQQEAKEIARKNRAS